MDSEMKTTHSLSETTYLQVNDIDSNGNESNFTDIRGGDIVRITEPGDKAVTLYIKKKLVAGLFEVFVQEGTGRPRSNEVHFLDLSATTSVPLPCVTIRSSVSGIVQETVFYDGDCYCIHTQEQLRVCV